MNGYVGRGDANWLSMRSWTCKWIATLSCESVIQTATTVHATQELLQTQVTELQLSMEAHGGEMQFDSGVFWIWDAEKVCKSGCVYYSSLKRRCGKLDLSERFKVRSFLTATHCLL